MKDDAELNFLLEWCKQGPPGSSVSGMLAQIVHLQEQRSDLEPSRHAPDCPTLSSFGMCLPQLLGPQSAASLESCMIN